MKDVIISLVLLIAMIIYTFTQGRLSGCKDGVYKTVFNNMKALGVNSLPEIEKEIDKVCN